MFTDPKTARDKKLATDTDHLRRIIGHEVDHSGGISFQLEMLLERYLPESLDAVKKELNDSGWNVEKVGEKWKLSPRELVTA